MNNRMNRALPLVIIALLAVLCGCGPAGPAASARRLDLPGVTNARDLGGLTLKNGGTVPRGRVFRSGSISGASQSAVEKMRQMGVRTTLDLREDAEVAKQGSDEDVTGSFARTVRAPLQVRTSAAGYKDIVKSQAKSIAKAFRTLADERSYPVLIHCTAGKDRTGVVSALLLELLGVPRDRIMEDYLLSRGAGAVDGAWLEAVFKAVDTAGGISGYLSGIGIDQTAQDRIRKAALGLSSNSSRWPCPARAA